MLAGELKRNVHDGTGYKAKVDLNLKWAPELGSQTASEDEASLPPLPLALEKEMGLRLVPTRGLLLDRGMMGDGVVDLRAVRAAVEAAGYRGPAEVEIFSRD